MQYEVWNMLNHVAMSSAVSSTTLSHLSSIHYPETRLGRCTYKVNMQEQGDDDLVCADINCNRIKRKVPTSRLSTIFLSLSEFGDSSIPSCSNFKLTICLMLLHSIFL